MHRYFNQDQVIIHMSRISRLVILVTSVAAVVGAMAGTASAVTWDVAGTGTFTATGPQGTLSTSTGNLVCPVASATGTYTAGSFAGATYSGVAGTVTYQGCALAGVASEVTCEYRLTATTQPTQTTLTTGTADVTCGVFIANNLKVCHIDGQVPGTYHDRSGGLADTLAIATSSALRSTAGTSNCPLGNNDVGHLSPVVFTVTSNGGNGPHIVRTA